VAAQVVLNILIGIGVGVGRRVVQRNQVLFIIRRVLKLWRVRNEKIPKAPSRLDKFRDCLRVYCALKFLVKVRKSIRRIFLLPPPPDVLWP
jgi:hypothetical protein